MQRKARLILPVYGAALGAVGLASLLTCWIWPLLESSPFSLFFAAVMVSAWYGGCGPGLFGTTLSALVCDYVFLRPYGSLSLGTGDLMRVGAFVLGAVLITSLVEARRRFEMAEQRQGGWLERTLAGIRGAMVATDPGGRVVFDSLGEFATHVSVPVDLATRQEEVAAERERLLGQLEAERARLVAVLQQLPSGVIIAEAPSGRLLQYNEEAARILRHSLAPSGTIHGPIPPCAVQPDGRPYQAEEYPIAGPALLRGEVVKEEELRYYYADSSVAYLSVNSAPIRDVSGRIVAAVSILRDISDRRRAEEERTELLRRLVTSQEEERHRIARELHDEMGQHLTAFLLGLKTLKDHAGDHPVVAGALHRLRELANQMGREVHRIALELRPSALDDWGLRTALMNYVGEWSRHTRIMVQLHCSGLDRRRLPAPIETALYRIAQEALTNVLKHAHATRVSVIVERRPDHVLAIIEDNGRGFDAESVQGKPGARRRLGLLGMGERVTQVGGTLEFESSPGGGTSLFIRVPLPGGGEDGP